MRDPLPSKQNLGSQRAADWWPFTQNHDPSFISALRDAYAQGFNAGHAEAEPDLVFHEVMHELGARDGETIFDLLKRLKSERSAHETTAGCTTFEVRNGPASLPCDHCGKSVSDHLCPSVKTKEPRCADPAGCPHAAVCAHSGGCRYRALGLAEKTEAESVSLDYKLPCEVRLPPNTSFGRGVALRSLMYALRFREGHPDEYTKFDDERSRAIALAIEQASTEPRSAPDVTSDPECKHLPNQAAWCPKCSAPPRKSSR